MTKAILVGVITGLVLMVTGYGSQDKPTMQELRQTNQHIIALAKETESELTAEKAAHQQTKTALLAAQQATADTQSKFNAYKLKTGDKINRANEWLAEKPHVMEQVHRAKIIATILILAVAGLAVLKIGGKIGLAVGATFAPAAITFIWTWL